MCTKRVKRKRPVEKTSVYETAAKEEGRESSCEQTHVTQKEKKPYCRRVVFWPRYWCLPLQRWVVYWQTTCYLDVIKWKATTCVKCFWATGSIVFISNYSDRYKQ